MARDIIEGNFRTFYGFLNVTLFVHLRFRLIELMSMVFFFYLTCRLITVQECAKLLKLFKDAGQSRAIPGDSWSFQQSQIYQKTAV